MDGYAGYRTLAEKGEVRLAFCWAHARRRFYELAVGGPAPTGALAVVRYAERHGTRRPWLVQLLAKRATKVATG